MSNHFPQEFSLPIVDGSVDSAVRLTQTTTRCHGHCHYRHRRHLLSSTPTCTPLRSPFFSASPIQNQHNRVSSHPPLRLACETRSEKLMVASLNCITNSSPSARVRHNAQKHRGVTVTGHAGTGTVSGFR